MKRLRRFFDLQLFDGEQSAPVAPETTPAAAPDPAAPANPEAQNTVPAPTAFTEPTGDTFSSEGLQKFLSDKATAKVNALGAVETPPATPDGTQQTPPAASPDAPPAATPPVAAAPTAPAQQQVVAIPPDLLTALGNLAMRALPQPEAQAPAIPEPVLPPLPEPPEILKGTKEDREAKYMEDPTAFMEAALNHQMETRRVQIERDRITSEHKAQVSQHQLQQGFQAAFTEQVVKLGQETFNQRADVAQEFIKAHPELVSPDSKVPAKSVVEMAFQYAEAKSAPAQVTVDVLKMTPEQKKSVKEALRQEIITEYLATRTQPGAAPPVTINTSIPAGKTPLAPPQMPQDLDEAQRQFVAARGVPRR